MVVCGESTGCSHEDTTRKDIIVYNSKFVVICLSKWRPIHIVDSITAKVKFAIIYTDPSTFDFYN